MMIQATEIAGGQSQRFSHDNDLPKRIAVVIVLPLTEN